MSEPSFGTRCQSAAVRESAVSFAMATTFSSTCQSQQSPANVRQSVVAVRWVGAKAHEHINRGLNVVQRPGRLTMNLLMLGHLISPPVEPSEKKSTQTPRTGKQYELYARFESFHFGRLTRFYLVAKPPDRPY